jgi:hypothetical protein
MVPVASIVSGITFVVKFHIRYIYVVRSVYLKFFGFFHNHISISCECNVYYHTSSLIIIIIIISSGGGGGGGGGGGSLAE